MYKKSASWTARGSTFLCSRSILHACLLLFVLVLACLSDARADDIEYVYDDAGRLVQASNLTAGQAVQYRYDAAGNITSQVTQPLSTLSIGHFSPASGPVGTQVTISGTGFSTTPASNSVSFHGVGATVIAATQTQLVAIVPASATSGTIAVQVGANTATSTDSFVVTAGTGAPVITGLNPVIGNPGAPVTISGSGFDPVPANNRVRFSGSAAQVVSVTPTSIVAYVPAGIGSGKVRVTTPRGLAVSPMDFIVVPPGYNATSILSNGRVATDGSPATVTLGTASRVGLQLFEGTAGDLLTIGITSTTFTSATIKVISPQNTQIATGTVTAAGQGVQIPKLTSTGTYTIVVDPGANTGSLTLNVLKPLQGTLSLGGSATNVTITPAGRRAQLTFSGTQGTFANLSLSSVTVSAGTLSVFTPKGELLISAPFTTSGLNIAPNLPVSGTYTVLVDPTGSVAGSLTISLQASTSPVLTTNTTYSLGLTNTSAVTLTFRANVGDYLSLAAVTTAQPIRGLSAIIRGPDGVQVMTKSMTTASVTGGWSGSMVLNMPPVSVPGTYTVVVQQTTSVSGTVQLTLSTPQTLAFALNSGAHTLPVNVPGQGLSYSIAATAGQYLAFSLDVDRDQPNRINAAAVTILKPDGTALATGNLATTLITCTGTCIGPTGYYGSVVVNTGQLTMTGTYRVLVQQTGGGQIDTGTLVVSLTTPISGALTDNSAPNVSITNPGQGLLYTFSAAAGDYRAFTVHEHAAGISSAAISLFAPDGSLLQTGTMATSLASGKYSGSVILNSGPLQQTGTYRVLVQQVGGGQSNTGTLEIAFTTPAAGSLIADGSLVNINLTPAGRGIRYTFSGSAGQFYALNLSEDVQDIKAATVKIIAPDASVVASGPLATVAVLAPLGAFQGWSGTSVVNIGPLPTSGTYEILLQQTGAGNDSEDVGTLGLRLSSPLSASITPNGSSVPANVTTSGQSVQYTFSGTAGAVYAAAVTENKGDINAAKVSIVAPDGSVVATSNLVTHAVNGPFGGLEGYSGGVIVNAGPLVTSGTYSVLIQQTGTQRSNTGTLVVTLTQPDTGTLPALIPITQPGRGIFRTFSGTAGQFRSVQVAESYGSYISSADISVFNPDGTLFRTSDFTPSTCGSCDGYQGNTTYELGYLTQTGNYSVLVQQSTLDSSGTGALTVSTGQNTPSTGSGPTSYSTSTPGQQLLIPFNAVAGQTIDLALMDLAVVPTSQTTVAYDIVNPSGSVFRSNNCTFSAAGCNVPLYRLPETGTYTLRMKPSATATISLTVTQTTPTLVTLTPGVTVNASHSPVGMMGLYTFTAQEGQTFALRINNIATVPSGKTLNLYIFRNEGNSTPAFSTTSSTSAIFNLENLASGTYTLVVYSLSSTAPVTNTMQITLAEQAAPVLTGAGNTVTATTSVAGQRVYLKAPAIAGQSLNVALSPTSTTPTGNTSVPFEVRHPDGTQYYTGNCTFNSGGCNLPIYRTPFTGPYTFIFSPGEATVSFTATMTTASSTPLALNTPVNLNLTPLGQVGRFSFTATEGQSFGLRIGNVVTSPANKTVKFNIYKDDDSAPTFETSTTTGSTFNLENLAAGTYTLLIYEVTGTTPVTATMTVTLQPQVGGSLSSESNTLSVSTAIPSQNVYLKFPAQRDQSVDIALTGLSTAPVNQAVDIETFAPDGSSVATANCTFNANGCNLAFYRLPQDGIYTIVLKPSNATVNLTATYTTAPSTELAVGSTVSLNLTPVGQMARFTFTATEGQNLGLRIGNIVTSPANKPLKFNIYAGASTTVMQALTSSTGATFNLENLVAGTYTLLIYEVTQTTPVTATLDVSLQDKQGGVFSGDGSALTVNTPILGQNVYFDFAANTGDSANIALTGLSTVPAGTNSVPYEIKNPNGTSYTTGTCVFNANGCDIPFYRVPQTGTYKLILRPGEATLNLTATYTVPTLTPLTAGVPVNVTLTPVGEMGMFTFTTTATQNVAVTLSGLTTAPVGKSMSMRVYNGATALQTVTTSTGATINLANLAAGTYTVIIYCTSTGPATSSMQLVYN